MHNITTVKQPNVVSSRHLLATRKQKPGESLQEFLLALQILSKNCQFRDVFTEEYRQELVRDAFVSGLALHHIRQQLLENTEFTVDRAYTTAKSLHMAQEHSAVYYSETRVTATVSPKHELTATKQALMTTKRRQEDHDEKTRRPRREDKKTSFVAELTMNANIVLQ